jgi:ABC-2 type transport system permease protein
MKQFKTIFTFEYLGYIKNKIFIGLTLVVIIIMGIVLFYPRFNGGESMNMDDFGVQFAQSIALKSEVDYNLDTLKQYITQNIEGAEITVSDKSDSELKSAISDGEYDIAVIITSPLSYRYIVDTAGLTDMTTAIINEALSYEYKADIMRKAGLTAEQSQEILTAEVTADAEIISNDQSQSFFYTYILMFMLYFAVLIYGQYVAQGVAVEKSSRTMELLITHAKPVSLMFGKILGAGAAGFTQLVLILGAAIGFYATNKTYWQDNMMISSVFDMPLKLVAYTVLFFTLGFLIYSFMYGALASLASRLEDVSTLTMPVTFIMIFSFMVTIFSMVGDINSPLMKAASFFPLTSPMAMFTRIAMGNVPAYEIAISVAVLIASTVLIGCIAAAIYRIGVLMYGKPPKFNELSRALRNNKTK